MWVEIKDKLYELKTKVQIINICGDAQDEEEGIIFYYVRISGQDIKCNDYDEALHIYNNIKKLLTDKQLCVTIL